MKNLFLLIYINYKINKKIINILKLKFENKIEIINSYIIIIL